ncbi:MAG: ribosome biogenesis GTPase YlqF [Nannocystis sp.]|nr:ribosome biogenesis GTPase YlqF [Nannocystis sp.]MBA3545310.1 ribosome biogenesis GTPase YlqF [Nannocystis sp.]
MSLQWYPGHMTKARRELAALMPSQDVVIEVLDARLPEASSNPLITELRGEKACIKVLTRSDLADPMATQAWLNYFEGLPDVVAFAATTDRPQETRRRIADLSRGMSRHRGPGKPVRGLIAGVPNVGKSTLINILMERTVAKVGDKPAVTKEQQAVRLRSGMEITDSPGLMWPKIEDESRAFRLALSGSIPDTAIDYLTIGMFGARFLLARYPELVMARYKLPTLPAAAELLLHEIGRRRGGLRKGGTVDLHKAAEIFVHEFRGGVIGRITLDLPVESPPVPAGASEGAAPSAPSSTPP